ncbi:MAG: sulfatase [Candidatus Moraniibacteriota bacterium]|jgi:arylsulfatase A-like enzyme
MKIQVKEKKSIIAVVILLIITVVIFYSREVLPKKESDIMDVVRESCEDCNVILVTMDTTRADHFSSYGYDRDTTTLIDKLAKKGILFKNNFVQMPYTPTSHWSIMSGTYPHTHKHYSPGIPIEDGGPDDTDLPFIAKILKENHYATIAFMGSKMVHSLVPGFDMIDLTPAARKDNTAQEVTDKAITWIQDNSERKFFTWIHYWDPHDPYKPPAEYVYPDSPEEEFDKFLYMQRRYDGEIKHVDYQFNRIIELLRELKIDDKTIIVITSDHGEAFGEHEKGLFAPNTPNQLTRGHYQTVYDEEIHVPLVIYNPANKYIGEEVEELTQSIDILPTILDMLSIDVPKEVEGSSLVPLINGEVAKINDFTFSILKYVENELVEAKAGKKQKINNGKKKFGKGLRATLRTDEWKLIRFVNSVNDVEEIEYVLYDMNNGEDENVLEGNPEIATAMIDQLELMLKAGNITNEEIKLTEEEIQILKSLGYLK